MSWWDELAPWMQPQTPAFWLRPPGGMEYGSPEYDRWLTTPRGLPRDPETGLNERDRIRLMPPSSAPFANDSGFLDWRLGSPQERENAQLRNSMPWLTNIAAPPVPPVPSNIRGPMQATEAPSPSAPLPVERFGMRPQGPATPEPTGAPPDLDRALGVVRKFESGGKYDIVGPEVTYKNGTKDRAYGAYQVMGANIPAWTEKWLGKRMTPQEFLANPQAQDAVARAQFGEYANKHGVENAFAMWASGRPLAQSANDKDLAFGTSVRDIVAARMKALGAPSATTSASPAAAVGEPLRSAKTAPMPGEMAPRRTPFDWGPDANIWQMAMGMGQGLMKPTLYGTMGAIQQGLEGAAQAAQAGSDRELKRELMRSQIAKAKEGNPTELMRNYQMARLQGYKGTIMEYVADLEAKKKTAELAAEKAVSLEGAKEQLRVSANTVLTNLDRAEKMAEKEWTATGLPAAATGWIPGTPAYEMRNRILLPIKSAIGLDRLTQMKTESGATLGQVAIFELQSLQNSIAGLENAVTKEGFLQALRDVKARYADVMRKAGGTMPTFSNSSSDMGNGWSVRVK